MAEFNKTVRTQLRRLFTTTYNKLVAAYDKQEDVSTLFAQLKDKSERLFQLDSDIIRELLDEKIEEQELVKEYDSTESYRDKWADAQHKYSNSSDKNSKDKIITNKAPDWLPRLQLQEFDLEPRTWLSFWAQFSRVHGDKNILEEDKLQYLLHSLQPGTKARHIVESYPILKGNYSKAIDQLKSRFGKDNILLDIYTRDILMLLLNKKTLSLSDLYDKLNTQLRALDTLGVTTDRCAFILYPLVESCLPIEILKQWQRTRTSSTIEKKSDHPNREEEETNILTELMNFLSVEVASEERVQLAQSSFLNTEVHSVATAASLVSTKTTNQVREPILSNSICIFCDKPNHMPSECFQAQKLTLVQRKAVAMKKGVCLNCLRRGHLAKKCRTNISCLCCNQSHLVIMCPDLIQSNKQENQVIEQSTSSYSATQNKQVLLQTLKVQLVGSKCTKIVRLLCDSGSQHSYVTEKCAAEVGLTLLGHREMTHCLFGGQETQPENHKMYNLELKALRNNFTFSMQALNKRIICNNVPYVSRDLFQIMLNKNIELADNGEDCLPVDILLGADYLGQVLTGEITKFDDLCAINTRFGWLIMGPVQTKNRSVTSVCIDTTDVSNLWALETLGILDPIEIKTKEERDCLTLNKFNESIEVNSEKRYETMLPFKDAQPLPESNYNAAFNRLCTVTKKLTKSNKYDVYDGVFKEWLEEGIIERVTPDPEVPEAEGVHYIPHRPVFKERSTTKTRPVFDASAQDARGISLNSCLETGPNLIEKIPDILNRFRINKVGVVADIRRAFCQISINAEHRDLLRFLWWDGDNVIVFRHTRVPFGLTCSPFILGATLNYHLDQTQTHTDTVNILKNSFYVDNCVASVDDKNNYKKFREEAKAVLNIAKFDLRGWTTNLDEDLDNQETITETVLGMLWDRESDALFCDIEALLKEIAELTLRVLLSKAQTLFDPIGFTAPAILFLKLLVQDAKLKKIAWDAPVSEEIRTSYTEWMSNAPLLRQVRIPRYFGEPINNSNCTVHIFVDASRQAYGACAFLRLETNPVKLRLLKAKTRVVPLTKQTRKKGSELQSSMGKVSNNPSIPRLELMAAVVGVRIANTLKNSLGIDLNFTFWSDSTTTLWWIQERGNRSIFVRNRVKEIIQTTAQEQWRHVPGPLNPADVLTRPCTPKTLLISQWWQGPAWLRNGKETWPQEEIERLEEESEENTKGAVNICTEVKERDRFERLFTSFSSYNKIVRTMAWMLRFGGKENKSKGSLGVQEIGKAETTLLRLLQRESIEPSKIKNLRTFKDEDGLIKIQSRVLEEDLIKPLILLPTNHILVTRIIEDIHREENHAGVSMTLNKLREKFWVLKGRQAVRRVVTSCGKCKRYSSKAVPPSPTVLPVDRTCSTYACFQVCGVDATGPIILKDNTKVWILLFTCSVYRAVHFEVMRSMSTECFLLALRRFLSRRNCIQKIYSDHGSNFIGAKNMLNNIDWKSVEEFSTLKKVEWKMIPPKAPFYGGWYERLFGLLKTLMRRSLGKAALGEEELTTLVCEMEHVLNNRPLTYDAADSTALRPLTPNHFLVNSFLPGELATEAWDEIDSKSLNNRAKYISNLRTQLRTRFIKEYLNLLWMDKEKKGRNWQVGEVVLVEKENYKRVFWPLARILKLYPSQDGEVRVVELQTQKGRIVRPVQKLYPLEISDIDDSQNPSANDLQDTGDDLFRDSEDDDFHDFDDDDVQESSDDQEQLPLKVTSRGRVIRRPDRFD